MSQISRKLKPRKDAAIRNSIDSDSLTSLFHPWEHHHRPINFANIQTGRTVNCSEFYLFFISTLFLILLAFQGVSSAWSLLSKMRLNYLVDSSREIAYAVLPSCCFLLPSCWLTCSIHNHGKSQRYLPLVLVLLGFSICFTATGTFLGFYHSLRNDYKSGAIVREFNASMYTAMKFYNNNKKYKNAWDEIQTQFGCCGIESAINWRQVVEFIPDSCHTYNNNDNNHAEGCLRAIIKFLLWQINLLSGLNCVILAILCCAFIALTTIYLINKNSKSLE